MNKTNSSPLRNAAAIELVAARFRVLGEPARLRILHVLGSDEKTVKEICGLVAMQQPSVSKHLKMLAAAGFVARRPRGAQVLYRLDDPAALDLCRLACDGLRERLEDQIRSLPESVTQIDNI
jgi:DNA-binding transcriptional ArsR family regulator